MAKKRTIKDSGAKPDEIVIPRFEDVKAEVAAPPWLTIDLGWLQPAIAPGPSFPTTALPTQVESLVKGFAAERRLSVDFVASAIIGGASAAIGNRARLLGYDGNAEPLTLFMALVGWPATGKSLALSIAETALMRIEDSLYKERGELGVAASAMARTVGGSVKARLSHEGIEARSRDETSPQPASPPRLLLSEFSVAGILKELQGAAEGRFVLIDELTGALSSSAGQAGLKSRALLLLAYDGKTYRKQLATQFIHVPALQIGILGGTQPDRVAAFVSRARDGFAPRFLWIAPEVEPIAAMATGSGPVAEWQAALTRMARIKPAADEHGYPRLIPLTESARAPLEAAGAAWTEAQKFAEPAQRDFMSRGRQQAMRLSGVIAQLEHSLGGKDGAIAEVAAGDIERTIALMNEYFLPMAERAFALAGAPRDSDAKRLAHHFRRLGRQRINMRDDVYRCPGSPTKSPAAAAEAIVELIERGFVREAPREPGVKGRPSVILEVHPALLAR
jgi:hypothetical protein